MFQFLFKEIGAAVFLLKYKAVFTAALVIISLTARGPYII